MKVYEDPNQNGPILMGFKGIHCPRSDAEVAPFIKTVITCVVENMRKREGNTLDKDEVIGFLEDLARDCKPETGYFFAPHIPVLPNTPKLDK